MSVASNCPAIQCERGSSADNKRSRICSSRRPASAAHRDGGAGSASDRWLGVCAIADMQPMAHNAAAAPIRNVTITDNPLWPFAPSGQGAGAPPLGQRAERSGDSRERGGPCLAEEELALQVPAFLRHTLESGLRKKLPPPDDIRDQYRGVRVGIAVPA